MLHYGYVARFYFLCTQLTILLPLTFSNFLDSNNPSMLWGSKHLVPKASASTFYYFRICRKIAQQFRILVVIYFYRFIIIFNLTLQQVLLVLEFNDDRNFCQQMSGLSIPFIYIWKYIIKIRYVERAFDHLHLLLACYIFLREVLQIESMALLYFKGVWRQF